MEQYRSNLPTEPTWFNQLQHAKELYKLSPKEVLAHARVSSSNKHFCHSCFCCACLVIYRNRGEMS